MKKVPLIILLILVIMLIAFVFLNINGNESQSDKLTAMEGYVIAIEVAGNRSDSPVLCGVTPLETPDNDGTCSGWRFYFLNNLDGNMYEGYDVKVYAGQNSSIYEYGIGNTTPRPIYNWTIDSDEAINIAFNNQEINIFFCKLPGHK